MLDYKVLAPHAFGFCVNHCPDPAASGQALYRFFKFLLGVLRPRVAYAFLLCCALVDRLFESPVCMSDDGDAGNRRLRVMAPDNFLGKCFEPNELSRVQRGTVFWKVEYFTRFIAHCALMSKRLFATDGLIRRLIGTGQSMG